MLGHARQLAELISDYRNHEGIRINSAHVMRWADQFPVIEKTFVVEETSHVLRSTYLSAIRLSYLVDQLVNRFAIELNNRQWINTDLAGNSQSWMLDQARARGFESNLEKTNLLFLDDVIFSGGRAYQDIKAWTKANRHAMSQCGDVLVLSLFRHASSSNCLINNLEGFGLPPYLHPLGYSVRAEQLKVVRDGRYDTDQSTAVLRCIGIPEIYKYPEYSKHFHARTPGYPQDSMFSSDAARTRYERVMFEAGLDIRRKCLSLPKHMRPLGATHLSTPGFGALLVTMRNCPNNCPLAWWVDAPWHPLFPRRKNIRYHNNFTDIAEYEHNVQFHF